MNGISMDNEPSHRRGVSGNMSSDLSSDDGGGALDTMSVGDDTVSQGDEEMADDNMSVSTVEVADRETRALWWLRGAVLTVLSLATVTASCSVYRRTRRAQRHQFVAAFDDAAAKLQESFVVNLHPLQSLAVDVLSYARYGTSSSQSSSSSSSTTQWPLVEVPDFAERAAATRQLGHPASSLLFLPLVRGDDAAAWESFSVEHQDWLQDKDEVVALGQPSSPSSSLHGDEARAIARQLAATHDNNNNGIRDHIFDFDGPVGGQGPFLPLWETSPVTANLTQWVNLNLFAVQRMNEGLTRAIDTGHAVLSNVLNMKPGNGDDGTPSEPEPIHLDLFLNVILGKHTDYTSEPVSPLVYPLVDHHQSQKGNHGNDDNDSSVVGLLVSLQYWRHALEHVLQPSAHGLVAVIHNECQQTFTYQVNGATTTFLGKGDLHDKHFSSMKKTAKLQVATQPHEEEEPRTGHNMVLDADYCSYSLSIYPSQKMWHDHVTSQPLVNSIVVLTIFLFSCAIFVAYDLLVERRQKLVMEQAVQSTAIVSSLFPEAVRERLFQDDDAQQQQAGGGGSTNNNMQRRRRSSDGGSFFGESVKMRRKSYLSDDGTAGEPGPAGGDKPIADLFPHCTVLFADLSGFTAWSSLRDPAQVFTLLEAIYHSFDQIARKRGVFKVETVGDSYVAVTGLPEPQEDHAIIMARFARDCKNRMNEVTRQLELTLGPDTGDLKMRFGMHSGPVTAGVLRGERSRFQLFGDTVNTAARMESTGERDRIQCSQLTADILIEAGKGHWVKAREKKVHAKGKGELQTYWVEVTSGRKPSADMSVPGDGAQPESKIWGAQDEIPDVVTQRAKHQRLIDYSVDLLTQHLKRVEARRQVLAMSGRRCSLGGEAPEIHKPSTEGDEDGPTVLDEVTEVIRLPKFDARSVKGHVDPESIELDARITSQLKRYVAIIAAMYRQNPFHNFEHASHVVMSVNKLMQRVVAPQSQNNVFKKKGSKTNNQELASELHNYTYGITSDPLAQFAILFSALIHDVDHWGVSNNQLIKEGAPMSEKYKGKSIAEQNSVDLAWDLLMDPDEYPDLQKCIFQTDAEYKRFRQVVVNVVMAPDIFDRELSDLRKNRWSKAFDPSQSDEDDDNRKATIVIEHIMQASDVAHTMQHWHVYQKWNRRLFDELYTAWKAGRMGVDPSTFWYNGEIKFFDTYVIPLAKKLKDCGVFGVSSDECLNYAINNRKEWESKGEMITAELVSNYNQREAEEAERKEKEREAAAAAGAQQRKGKKSRFARRRSLFTAGG